MLIDPWIYYLGTSNGVGANGAAGKHANGIDMVDGSAPSANHENLLALLQLLHTLPLWFSFVLPCFAPGVRSGVRSGPRLGLSCGCWELLGMTCTTETVLGMTCTTETGPKLRLLRIGGKHGVLSLQHYSFNRIKNKIAGSWERDT